MIPTGVLIEQRRLLAQSVHCSMGGDGVSRLTDDSVTLPAKVPINSLSERVRTSAGTN